MKLTPLISLFALILSFASIACVEDLGRFIKKSVEVESIEDYIYSKNPSEVRSLEIGPAHAPICPDCIQTDRYVSKNQSRYDAFLKKTNSDMSYAEWMKENGRTTDKKWGVELYEGVQSDAQYLPFRNETFKLVVMNHFPTKIHPKDEEANVRFLENVIKEIYRVLDQEGEIVITGAFRRAPFDLVDFKITSLVDETGEEIGIVLTKSSQSMN